MEESTKIERIKEYCKLDEAVEKHGGMYTIPDYPKQIYNIALEDVRTEIKRVSDKIFSEGYSVEHRLAIEMAFNKLSNRIDKLKYFTTESS